MNQSLRAAINRRRKLRRDAEIARIERERGEALVRWVWWAVAVFGALVIAAGLL